MTSTLWADLIMVETQRRMREWIGAPTLVASCAVLPSFAHAATPDGVVSPGRAILQAKAKMETMLLMKSFSTSQAIWWRLFPFPIRLWGQAGACHSSVFQNMPKFTVPALAGELLDRDGPLAGLKDNVVI